MNSPTQKMKKIDALIFRREHEFQKVKKIFHVLHPSDDLSIQMTVGRIRAYFMFIGQAQEEFYAAHKQILDLAPFKDLEAHFQYLSVFELLCSEVLIALQKFSSNISTSCISTTSALSYAPSLRNEIPSIKLRESFSIQEENICPKFEQSSVQHLKSEEESNEDFKTNSVDIKKNPEEDKSYPDEDNIPQKSGVKFPPKEDASKKQLSVPPQNEFHVQSASQLSNDLCCKNLIFPTDDPFQCKIPFPPVEKNPELKSVKCKILRERNIQLQSKMPNFPTVAEKRPDENPNFKCKKLPEKNKKLSRFLQNLLARECGVDSAQKTRHCARYFKVPNVPNSPTSRKIEIPKIPGEVCSSQTRRIGNVAIAPPTKKVITDHRLLLLCVVCPFKDMHSYVYIGNAGKRRPAYNNNCMLLLQSASSGKFHCAHRSCPHRKPSAWFRHVPVRGRTQYPEPLFYKRVLCCAREGNPEVTTNTGKDHRIIEIQLRSTRSEGTAAVSPLNEKPHRHHRPSSQP
ncbi:uncharacterized protein LOC129752056 [Uranotaenia lowii]|uniref:uncharacterized protein LOC129752056 n=1 Tax=Uranotaenia lowii TaxID=190385 RepID=UPI00247AB089|nr:uncharacterized protein LOC129752056 [Uranotaenia lowii]